MSRIKRDDSTRNVTSSLSIHGVVEVKVSDKKIKSDSYEEGYFWCTQLLLVSHDGRSDVDISIMNGRMGRIPVTQKYEGLGGKE